MRWFVLLIFLLAGCAAPVDDVVVDDVPVPEPELEVLDANVSIDAPSWDVGTWHGHHVFLGNGDIEGFHINSVVIEAGSSYLLATDDADFAKVEAAFDVPMAGAINSDLSTEAFGGPWSVYDFPITDGKTWAGMTRMEIFGEPEYTIDFEATFNPAIKTATGTYEGFDILGTVAGVPIIETDFVPEIGWYANFIYYDVNTEDPEDYFFRVISMGFGDGWTGTYYLGEGEPAVFSESNVYPDGNGVTAEADPYNSFLMRDEHTALFGFAYAYAYSGASALELVAPDNTRYSMQAVDPSGAFAIEQISLDVPAQQGEWRLAQGGAGVAAGAGAYLWNVIVSEGNL